MLSLFKSATVRFGRKALTYFFVRSAGHMNDPPLGVSFAIAYALYNI